MPAAGLRPRRQRIWLGNATRWRVDERQAVTTMVPDITSFEWMLQKYV